MSRISKQTELPPDIDRTRHYCLSLGQRALDPVGGCERQKMIYHHKKSQNHDTVSETLTMMNAEDNSTFLRQSTNIEEVSLI